MKNFLDYLGNTDEYVAQSWFDFAVAEIYRSFGHKVKIDRKHIDKYGFNGTVGTSEELIVPWGVSPANVYRATGNDVDTISSDDAADVGNTIYLECMVEQPNGDWKFQTQTAVLNGQNKVTLTVPSIRITRMRGGYVW